MIEFSKDNTKIMIEDDGGYDAVWANVPEVLKAIKEHCPKEWREAIQEDLDQAQWDREYSDSRHSED